MDNSLRKPQSAIQHVWRIVLVLASLPPALLLHLFFTPFTLWWYVGGAVWLLSFLFFYLVYIPVRYRNLSFSLSEEFLTVHSGVFSRRVRIMPIASIQFTVVWDSPLHRAFRLCALIVSAAGAHITLPGLTREDAKTLAQLLPYGWQE